MKTLPLALAAFLIAAPAHAGGKLSGSTLAIPRQAVSGGGAPASGAGLTLDGAAAEVGASTSSGSGLINGVTPGGFNLYAGLMPLMTQPGSVVTITAVSKTTGTLELSWAAPGLDGLVGNVVNGFYRIDTSSDPLHVFDPTVYLVEFATNVSPGDPQAYLFTGLQPNTTYTTYIYLVDSRKVVAETAKKSAESTFANLPVNPTLSYVGASSVTFSWQMPAHGAEAFHIDGSSTDFGAILPGGVVVTSQTPDGLTLSLTVAGLDSETTYYFKLASLDWQGESNFTTIIATCTARASVLPVFNLAVSSDAAHHSILLTWGNEAFLNWAGVLVLASTNPITAAPAKNIGYSLGDTIGGAVGGGVVKAVAAKTSYLATSLALDTTQYFKLFSKNSSLVYSVAVSTSLALDLPPMSPAALTSQLSVDGTSVTLNWAAVTSKLDGSAFKSAVVPSAWELAGFDVYRATGALRSNWVWVGSAPVTATNFLTPLPDPASVFFYKITARDGFDPSQTDNCMVLDTLGNLYAVDTDQVSLLKVPASLTRELQPQGNSSGQAVLLRAQENLAGLGERVVKSVSFAPTTSPAGNALPLFKFSRPDVQVALHYDVVGGEVVPAAQAGTLALGGAKAAALQPAVSASAADQSLGVYWFDNKDYVKLYGQVDPQAQIVSVNAAMAGSYQIRTVARSDSFAFDLSGISNKAITPNGDGLNDTVVFTFQNPQDSAVGGKIFDMKGAFVADMSPASAVTSGLQWDGKSSGRVVPRGVYIYEIKAEGKTFTGTVVVIR